jgi:putative chitinase
MGNIENTDDGWNYRGRGIIMLTGKSAYAEAGKALGLDLLNNPDLAAEWNNAWLIAAWFLTTKTYKGTNIQKFMATNNIVSVTYAVNGGQINLESRKKYTNRLTDYLKATNIAMSPPVIMPVLRYGSVGPEVKALQQLLWDIGFACGTVDGHFGENVVRAVKEAQRHFGLVADAIVGPSSWRAFLANQKSAA